jgi:excisionase family DNA binding protein
MSNEQLTVTVPEGVRDRTGVGVRVVLEAARSGELPTLKPGRERLARIVDVDKWLASLVQRGYTRKDSAKAKRLGRGRAK